MTPDQYRNACKKLGISIVASATALGVSERTAQRYSRGETPVPETVAKLLRAMIRLGTIDI